MSEHDQQQHKQPPAAASIEHQHPYYYEYIPVYQKGM